MTGGNTGRRAGFSGVRAPRETSAIRNVPDPGRTEPVAAVQIARPSTLPDRPGRGPRASSARHKRRAAHGNVAFTVFTPPRRSTRRPNGGGGRVRCLSVTPHPAAPSAQRAHSHTLTTRQHRHRFPVVFVTVDPPPLYNDKLISLYSFFFTLQYLNYFHVRHAHAVQLLAGRVLPERLVAFIFSRSAVNRNTTAMSDVSKETLKKEIAGNYEPTTIVYY